MDSLDLRGVEREREKLNAAIAPLLRDIHRYRRNERSVGALRHREKWRKKRLAAELEIEVLQKRFLRVAGW
jgi:hypothetical protein